MLNTQTICLPTMIFLKQSCVSENQLQNETAINNLNVIKTERHNTDGKENRKVLAP
jgi:hypothetical protein